MASLVKTMNEEVTQLWYVKHCNQSSAVLYCTILQDKQVLQDELGLSPLHMPSGKRAKNDAYMADTSVPDLPAVEDPGHAASASHLGKRSKHEECTEVRFELSDQACFELLGTSGAHACEDVACVIVITIIIITINFQLQLLLLLLLLLL